MSYSKVYATSSQFATCTENMMRVMVGIGTGHELQPHMICDLYLQLPSAAWNRETLRDFFLTCV